MAETVLVTGGAGFIGSHLVDRLLAEGFAVRVLDNFSTGRRENLNKKAEIFEGGLEDRKTAEKAVEGAAVIFHQAALPSVSRSVENPVATHDSNTVGTFNVLVAAKKFSVKRMVYAASSSAYGNVKRLPKIETMAASPLSPYAASKLIGEEYTNAFFRIYGVETVALRYFNVYGPRQDPNSPYSAVIPLFFKAATEHRPLTIFGDGKQTRDFTFVADVVEANLLALRAPKSACGRTYNIAGGKRVTLLELAKKIGKLVGPLTINHEAPRAGDVRHSLASIELAKKQLGYKPKWTLEEGLRETFRAMSRK